MEQFQPLNSLFTDSIMPIDKLAHSLLKVSAHESFADDWFVLHTVHEMLQSKLLRKQGLSATDWIFAQFKYCNDLVHVPTFPKIIHDLVLKFVNTFVTQ